MRVVSSFFSVPLLYFFCFGFFRSFLFSFLFLFLSIVSAPHILLSPNPLARKMLLWQPSLEPEVEILKLLGLIKSVEHKYVPENLRSK